MSPHVACCRCQQWRQDRLPQTFTSYDPSRWSQLSSQVHSQRISGFLTSYSADSNAWSNTIFWSDEPTSDASGSWLLVVLNRQHNTKQNKIAIWGYGRPRSCLDQKRPQKYLELMLSNMLRPTFVPNLVVLTWTRASAALDWLTLPLSIKTTRPDPPLHPHPPSKFKPNSTARSNRFSSGTPCVTLWNSLCSIPVTWVSTHNY